MKLPLRIGRLLAMLGGIALAAGAVSAAPVTGWLKDTSFGAGPTATLSNTNTNSPILGNGTSNNADNVAIYAAMPLVSLANGERATLTGSAQMIGTTTNPDFRWGLFKDDGVGVATAGWLGYFASADGIVWSKDPSGSSFATVTFASVASGRGFVLGQTSEPNNVPFNPGNYDFTMIVERFGNEVDVRMSISNAATSYSIVSPPFTESQAARLTFDFDRVGFLAGSALDADQIRFSGIDVSKSAILAPTLQVHSSGQVFVTNATGQSIDFAQYEITSSSGALNRAGWQSLDSQENDPFGLGWEEAGGSGPNVLAEVNLLSMAALGSGESLRLGNAFVVGGAQDLGFRYTTPAGEVLRGIVNYRQTGDYNEDGRVDAADFIVWRRAAGQSVPYGSGADGDGDGTIGAGDYQVWRANFGASAAGTGSIKVTGVPEPSGGALLLMAIIGTVSGIRAVRLKGQSDEP